MTCSQCRDQKRPVTYRVRVYTGNPVALAPRKVRLREHYACTDHALVIAALALNERLSVNVERW